jgi:hypothetical protein
MPEFSLIFEGKVMRFAANTKADAEAVIKKMADAHNALHGYAAQLAADKADKAEPAGGPDKSQTNSTSQRSASLRTGTVASPTPCDLADAIRDHYATRDLRAANAADKKTSREDAIRAAMTVAAPTK